MVHTMSTSFQKFAHCFEMEGKKLEQVTGEKDLGILIEDELNFHKQTAAATKNAKKK